MGERIELRPMQTWRPQNGERPRQIDQIQVAGAGDHPHPMGTLLVCWARSAGDWGWCTERSFKAWIRRTRAVYAGRVKEPRDER